MLDTVDCIAFEIETSAGKVTIYRTETLKCEWNNEYFWNIRSFCKAVYNNYDLSHLVGGLKTSAKLRSKVCIMDDGEKKELTTDAEMFYPFAVYRDVCSRSETIAEPKYNEIRTNSLEIMNKNKCEGEPMFSGEDERSSYELLIDPTKVIFFLN